MAKQTTETEPTAPAMTSEQFSQVLATIAQSIGGTNAALVEQIGDITKAVQKQRPENVAGPEISALNPLGERDHPRPELPCPKVWLGGFPIDREQSTREELELINRLQPGEYTVTRVDDETERVPVAFLKDDMGRLAQIRIGINKGREHRHLWPKLAVILKEIVSQQASPAAVAA